MASKSFHFTKDTIENIVCPKVEQTILEKNKQKNVRPKIVQHIYRDTKESGLVLVASYGNTKTFYLFKTSGGKDYKIKIGKYPSLSIAKARTKAAELKTQISKGINQLTPPPEPQDDEIDNTPSFKDFFFNQYIENYAKHKIKRWQDVIADINRQASHLYDKKLSSIQRGDIQKIFNDLTREGKEVMANKCVGRFVGIYNKAIEWELVEKNPALGIVKHKEKSRDRYLLAEEEQLFFDVLEKEPNETIKDFILMSLYTAARKSNVLAMRWDNISVINKTWYMPDTKNGEPHLIPLMDKAFQILEKRYENRGSSEWVFPSNLSKSGHLEDPKKTWDRLRKEAGLKDFRLHDLRRTMGSWMAISGASQYVIGKALNHKSPRSTATYVRLSLDPVREYMEKAGKLFDKNKEQKIVNRHKTQDEIKIASNNSVDNLQANDNTEIVQRKIAELEQQIATLKNKQGLQSE